MLYWPDTPYRSRGKSTCTASDVAIQYTYNWVVSMQRQGIVQISKAKLCMGAELLSVSMEDNL